MARMILIVNATQVITSENNPNGIFSIVSGFPKIFDSGVNGNIEQNMKNAKAAYYSQLSTIYGNTNASNRITNMKNFNCVINGNNKANNENIKK